MMPAMFTCARTAGWSAHILEQKRLGRLVRPSALYIGPGPRGADGGRRVRRADADPRIVAHTTAIVAATVGGLSGMTDVADTLQHARRAPPADGRFGCGPSKVRPEALPRWPQAGASLMGTSHRQAPVKSGPPGPRGPARRCSRCPTGYQVILGNGGTTAFWDAAALGLVRERACT